LPQLDFHFSGLDSLFNIPTIPLPVASGHVTYSGQLSSIQLLTMCNPAVWRVLSLLPQVFNIPTIPLPMASGHMTYSGQLSSIQLLTMCNPAVWRVLSLLPQVFTKQM